MPRNTFRVSLFCISVLVFLSGCAASPAEAKDRSLVDLFDDVSRSVVVLRTVQREAAPNQPLGEVAFSGLGSGVLIDMQGHIITAAHVVQTADLVEVEFTDGSKVTAAIVSSDPTSDLAMLKVDAMPEVAVPATLGDSDSIRVGEEIFVVGAPYGLERSLTVGHISGRHGGGEASSLGLAAPDAELFQTDAAINQGNSGGPMFDMQGNVIGIVSYILSQSGGFEGLGFVVTANTVRAKMLERRSFWSGITAVPIHGPVAKALNVPQAEALLVQNVALGSPGQKMGLRPSRIPVMIAGQTVLIGGDMILSIGDMAYSNRNLEQITHAIEDMADREMLKLRVLRGGEIVDIEFYGFYRQGDE
ncbi:MAG: trypsin-like peptidase domain-containing protein [Woeseiaceae bacterium]|nr:trypsin-like peptidase domain-containing protein [Woeseiaceae bacterium]